LGREIAPFGLLKTKRPPVGGLWLKILPVEFTDYMLWKLIAFAVAAFIYGVCRGLSGR
jgi:hypothetical protein